MLSESDTSVKQQLLTAYSYIQKGLERSSLTSYRAVSYAITSRFIHKRYKFNTVVKLLNLAFVERSIDLLKNPYIITDYLHIHYGTVKHCTLPAQFIKLQ